MFQPPQNTGMSQSMGSVAQAVPKISQMMVIVDKALILPKKIYININNPITVKAPKLITDGKEKPKATKSESAEKIKTEEKQRKIDERAKARHDAMAGWFKDMGNSLKKGLTDNPIVNFIKDHWGKIMIAAMAIFLKPEQWKTIWKGIKSLANWAMTDGVDLLKGIWETLKEWVPKLFDGIVEIVKFIGRMIDNVFGKKVTKEDVNAAKKAGQKEGESKEDFNERIAGMEKAEESGNRQGGLFGEGETGPLGIITGVLSGLALLTTGIGALGLLIAPGSTLLLGFTALKGLLKAPFNLIPKLPGIADAPGLGKKGVGTSLLKTAGKGLMAPGPIAAMVATALAAAAVGTALNKFVVAPMMDKYYKKEDAKEEKKWKKRMGRSESIEAIKKESGVSRAGFGTVLKKGSIAQRMDADLKGKEGSLFSLGGTVKPMTLEQVKKKYAPEIAKLKKDENSKKSTAPKPMSKTEFLQSEKYKGQMRGADGVVEGESTTGKQMAYDEYLENQPVIDKQVGVLNKRLKKLGKFSKSAVVRKREVIRINQKLDRDPLSTEIIEGLDPAALKVLGRDGASSDGGEEKPQLSMAEKKAKFRAQMNAPQPMVSPTMKADTLNQVQGENAELSSGTNAIVAPTTINNITNNYGSGGEGGTAIYGVPTAQKGTKVKHSNIR